MRDDSDKPATGGKGAIVIPASDIFERLKKQNAARAEARRYFEATRRIALQRRLVLRILNRDRDDSGRDRFR